MLHSIAKDAVRLSSGLFLPKGASRDTLAFPKKKGRHALSWCGEHETVFSGGGFQTWQEALSTAQVSGTQLTASVTPTSILPPAARFTLPANFFYIGRSMHIFATGQIGNIVTTPGTFTFDVRMGPTSNIIVWNGAATILSTTVHTTLPFWLEVYMTCRSIGNLTQAILWAQGMIMGQPFSFTSNPDLATSNSIGSNLLPNTQPAAGTGFDSTVAMVVDLFGTWSLSNANAITLTQYILEALN